jgi:apolipoprotein D and lipocalin family protein
MAAEEGEKAKSGGGGQQMTVVRGLDVARYMGRWYEIASFPSFFQPRDGRDTRATYRLLEDGATVHVLNETWSKGKRDYIEGTAYKADPGSDEAKLKVKFYLPPFLPIVPVVGDYWVLYVDDDYQYALVGEPRRKNLWVCYVSQLIASSSTSKLHVCSRAHACTCRSCVGRRASTRTCTTSWWSGPRRKATT